MQDEVGLREGESQGKAKVRTRRKPSSAKVYEWEQGKTGLKVGMRES